MVRSSIVKILKKIEVCIFMHCYYIFFRFIYFFFIIIITYSNENTSYFCKEIMKSSKGHGSTILWGELPPRETLKQEIITPDIIENVWRQVMDEANNTDCDYQIDRQPEYIQ